MVRELERHQPYTITLLSYHPHCNRYPPQLVVTCQCKLFVRHSISNKKKYLLLMQYIQLIQMATNLNSMTLEHTKM